MGQVFLDEHEERALPYDPRIMVYEPDAPKPVEEKQGPGALNIWADAFRTQNVVSAGINAFQNRYQGPTAEDTSYNAYAPENLAGYEEHGKLFRNVRNKQEHDHVKRRIDEERRAQQTLAEAGAHGVIAQVTANILDPTFLLSLAIPGVGTGRAVGAAVKIGAMEGAVAAGQEVAMHQFQYTREIDDSMLNVTASALTAGVIGGFATRMANAEIEAVTKGFETEIKALRDEADGSFGPGSIGAAEVDPTKLQNPNQLVSAGGLEKPLPLISGPAQRAAASEVEDVSTFGQKLVNDNFLRQGAADGTIKTETSVELELQKAQSGRAEVRRAVDESFYDFAKKQQDGYPIDAMSLADVQATARRLGFEIEDLRSINRQQWGALVSDALRNGDKSPIGSVTSAAQKIRSNILEPWYNRAVKAGLIDPERQLKGADSYLHRVYDVSKIADNRADFEDRLRQALGENMRKNGFSPITVAGRQIDDIDEIADLVAQEATDKILGEGRGVHAAFAKMSKYGPTAERVLDIPDNLIADYLENDVVKIIDRYTKAMAPQVALMEKFGTLDFGTAWANASADYASRIAAAKKAGDKKRASALVKERDAIKDQMEYVWNKMLGKQLVNANERSWDKISRVSRKITAPILLGGQMISSIPDLGRLVMVHGLSRSMKLFAAKMNPVVRALSREEAEKMGAGLDMVLHGRFEMIADIGDEVGYVGRFERGVDRMNEIFQYATGMKWWNSMLKQSAAIMGGDRIIENSVKGFKNISKNERTYLLKMGIDEQMADRIAGQFKKYGQKESSLHIGNTKAWDDQEAADAFRLAGLKDAETTINTPNLGTLPPWMDTPTMKLFMQFKSFLFASHQQTLIAGLQHRDANTYIGMLTMVGLGTLVSQTRQLASGQEPSSGLQAIADGVDRSGILSVAFEGLNYLNTGYGRMTGENLFGTERFRDRELMDLTGPAGGTLGKWWGVGETIVQDGLGEEAARKATRLLPGQNLYGLRPYQGAIDIITGNREYFDRVNSALEAFNPFEGDE